tara:strand:+ start:891 stop:1181 length:291 start_codon:yes stop_codon:yes gene_type:complete
MMSQGQTEINERRRQDAGAGPQPTAQQRKWLRRGLNQAGGKLPLFDEVGQKVSDRTVNACIEHGWAEPWFNNPLKPDWQVCKLTDAGRRLLMGDDA